jgi:DNA polymerase III delta prime subunit
MNTKILIPTQLFVGRTELLAEKTEQFLQEQFCKNQSQNIQSCYCNECRKIKNHQHEFIVFISPEKDYTVKDLDIIFEKANFALDQNQKFFFVLQKAQTLSSTCANKLLKILEEPPAGYNFILQTNNPTSILPTILSRCHVTNFSNKNPEELDYAAEYSSLTSFFYNQNLDNPADFEKELRKLELSDSQSIEILNSIINFYAKKILWHHEGKNPQEHIEYSESVYKFLNEKLKKAPQSGSSGLFWKNIYISFPKFARK